MALLVHVASVWVPFTSESKEAVAHYPEIIREIQLAAQECGRKLASHIRKKKHAAYQAGRRSIFELYIEEVAQALGKITGKSPAPIKREFLRLSDKVTEQELAEQDAALVAASEQVTRRPRRARGGDRE
jgi:DNA topoisomerase-6 subunit B